MNYFRADLISRTLSLREKNVFIFAHFGFVREIARKFIRVKMNTNKVLEFFGIILHRHLIKVRCKTQHFKIDDKIRAKLEAALN